MQHERITRSDMPDQCSGTHADITKIANKTEHWTAAAKQNADRRPDYAPRQTTSQCDLD